MNMKYKLIQRKNPQLPDAPPKWYAVPVNDGRISQDAISSEIVDLSSLSRGDVGNAINSMIDIIPKYLLMSKSVNLGDLGTFRLSFSSEGVDSPEQFSADKISKVRVIFTPSTSLLQALARVRFEKV